jgi:hypothetical protein
MSADSFERVLRDRLKAGAAELDRSMPPAPSLQALLVSPQAYRPARRPAYLRLGFGLAVAAALAVALISGSLLLGQSPAVRPLSSITPSATPSLATPSQSLITASPSPSLASPSGWPPVTAVTAELDPPLPSIYES